MTLPVDTTPLSHQKMAGQGRDDGSLVVVRLYDLPHYVVAMLARDEAAGK